MWLLIKTIKSLSYFKGGVMRGKDSFPPHIVSQQHANVIFAILQKKSQLAQGLIATQVDGNYLFSRVVSASRLSYLLNCSHQLAIFVYLSVVPLPQKNSFLGVPYIWLFDENIKKELVSHEFIRLMATIYFLGSSPTKYLRRVRA